MPDYVKAKIAERNGVELEWSEEYELIPENFPFLDPGFTATDVKDAIIEAKNTGVPGPPGPEGPPGESALRYEIDVAGATVTTVIHNFGKVPVDVVLELLISYEDNKYNDEQFNVRRFGTGISIAGAPIKVDPSTYTREDSLDFNSCTFTFNSPVTGRIVLLG
jgi:hypothetical protein